MKILYVPSLLLVACIATAQPATPTAFLQAARDGDYAAFHAYLRNGVDANTAQGDGTRALHYVILRNDLTSARSLLAAGADVHAQTALQVTPLLLACENGNVDIMKLLLKAGADPNARDGAGETMLMAAARSGNPHAVRLLLQHGAQIEAGDIEFGQTALIHAARAGNTEVVRVLLAAGANVAVRTRVEPAPPFRPNGGTRGKGVEKSPARGMRDSIPGGKTALLYAARDGHLDIVRLLLNAGADIEDTDPNGITPLLMAASNDRVEVARSLIERGADIDATDWYGRTPLWAAIDVRNRDTPLPSAGNGVDRGRALTLVQLLLERGAKPNGRIREMPVVRRHILPLGSLSWVDFTGETPFIRAALSGDTTVMRLLLSHGADPRITTDGGTTALAAAAGVNWVVAQTYDEGADALLEAVKICRGAGIDVNAANAMGVRAVHGAANRGSDAIIRYLAAEGAELDAKDKEARTPLDWAQGVFLATHPAQPKPSTIALLEKLRTLPEAQRGIAQTH
jgi:uncharacterized protein